METTTKTRSIPNKFFGYFVWLTLLCLAFVAGRSCDGKDAKYTKAWADSVRRESDAAVGFWQEKFEQSKRDGERSDEVIKNLFAETEYYKDKMQTAQKSAEHWHTQFKQAKELRDTITMVAACDSALPKYEEALEFAAKRHEADSLIIQTQEKKIYADSVLIALADSTIRKQSGRIDTLSNAVVVLNKQKKKQKFWRWVERVGIAVGTAFVFTR